jgi:hypothetical protein
MGNQNGKRLEIVFKRNNNVDKDRDITLLNMVLKKAKTNNKQNRKNNRLLKWIEMMH